MEILFISHKFPPTIGGMEKQSYELVTLTEQKHKVHKVLYDDDKENRVGFFFRIRTRVKKVLKENPSIDIIHLNDALMGYFSFWLREFTDKPIVVTFHGLDLVFPNKYFQNKIVPGFKKFDGFICVSQATAEECTKRGFDPAQVFTVPNGVDHDIADIQTDLPAIREKFKTQFGIDLDKRKIIVGLGRPVKRKGFSWFLEHVVPALEDDNLFVMVGPRKDKRQTPVWRKVIPQSWVDQVDLFFGATNDEERIYELAERQDVKNKVVQTGALPFKELMAILELADLFVMPNIKIPGDAEGFGLVALEASLRKTPVLASGIEGITEAIQDHKNGFLLPSENANAWIEKIQELLSDRISLKEMGNSFQQFTLNTYSWDKMVEGYIEVFEKIIAASKK